MSPRVAAGPRRIKRSMVRAALPPLKPMLAVLAAHLPADDVNWAYEFKWDGIRALAFIESGGLRLMSRNDIDVSHRYPELAGLARAVKRKPAILDGEIVALGPKGPSFSLLQQRMGVSTAAEAASRAKKYPVVYMIFDVLYLGGESVMQQPFTARRKVLESLKLGGPAWQTPPAHFGKGKEIWDVAKASNLEGVMAKRRASVYLPGQRSGDWRKIKLRMRQELVIGGWLPMEGEQHNGTLGAVLLGYYEKGSRGSPAVLRYAGKSGTGFNNETRARLKKMLTARAVERSPFDTTPIRNAHYARPELVAEFEFHEWTGGGRLRQPSFKGLRTDKDPRRVVRETAIK